ncbi:MAG TPA: bacillithiol system redox-active protein YtxJ, partial [Longimicrobiaceae bacterium]|nr:bacillithiol system redox-active protein YtxJ [Longimicrobiaceae bacterium]
RQEVDAAFEQERALLYKHSTRCPISAAAHGEVQRLLQRHPDAPVYMLDVNLSRDASRYVAERTGIEHHSPQAILLRGGSPAWHASHLDITADALAEQLGGGGR